MDASDYEQELEKCREWLAAQLRRDDVPDAVWGYVMRFGLPYDAITSSGEESWRELVEAAKARLEEMSEEVGSTFTPRREERGAPREISVEPSEYARKRARAFSEVAAALAGNHPRVRRFRRLHLGGRLLSDSEVVAFVEKIRGPHGGGPIWTKLCRLADSLAKTYRWREDDAVWFVLTGSAPQVRPLQMLVSIKESVEDYEPDTARITITADAWVEAKEVERAFRAAQRQVLRGDARPLPERTLEAVTFVARRMREHGKESWRERWEVWNSICPTCADCSKCRGYPKCQKGWRYDTYRGLRQVFERFIHPRYGWPRYKKPTPTHLGDDLRVDVPGIRVEV